MDITLYIGIPDMAGPGQSGSFTPIEDVSQIDAQGDHSEPREGADR
jgi:hypothetical protein